MSSIEVTGDKGEHMVDVAPGYYEITVLNPGGSPATFTSRKANVSTGEEHEVTLTVNEK
jgi:hypothetical protein